MLLRMAHSAPASAWSSKEGLREAGKRPLGKAWLEPQDNLRSDSKIRLSVPEASTRSDSKNRLSVPDASTLKKLTALPLPEKDSLAAWGARVKQAGLLRPSDLQLATASADLQRQRSDPDDGHHDTLAAWRARVKSRCETSRRESQNAYDALQVKDSADTCVVQGFSTHFAVCVSCASLWPLIPLLTAMALEIVLPERLVEKDVSVWALHGSICFIGAAVLCLWLTWVEFVGIRIAECRPRSRFRAICRIYPCEYMLDFGLAVGFVPPLLCMLGLIWSGYHRMPYERLVSSEIVSGDIVSSSNSLLANRSSMMSSNKDTLVYFSGGFINKAQAYDLVFHKRGTNYLQTVAPVYEAQDSGKLLGWAVPFEFNVREIDADICEVGDNEHGLGGLCGSVVRYKGGSSANTNTNTNTRGNTMVHEFELAGTTEGDSLLSGWWSMHGAELNHQSAAQIRRLPVFAFKDPSKQKDRLRMFVEVGLMIFIVGIVCHMLSVGLITLGFYLEHQRRQ